MRTMKYSGMCVALMAVLGAGAALSGCQNEAEEVVANEVAAPDADPIIVAAFPAFADSETRAASTEDPSDKKSWEEGDVIFVRLNGEGKWYEMKYTSVSEGSYQWKIDDPDFKMAKTDTYEAVYAPLYTLSSEGNELSLQSGASAVDDEYLTATGTRPILIQFTRNYSRIQVKPGDITVSLSLGEGFKSPNGEDFTGAASLKVNDSGYAYVYGSWEKGTELKLGYQITEPDDNGVYVGGSMNKKIASASVAGTSYSVDVDTSDPWLVVDLDLVEKQITDWSSYTNNGYKKIKVVGTWKEATSPMFKGNSMTTVDLSEVREMTKIPAYMFGYIYNSISVKLPNTIETIEKNAFFDARATIYIPGSVRSIGESAFAQGMGGGNYISFESFSSLTSIEYAAFRGCKEFKVNSWPGQITTIPTFVFYSTQFDVDYKDFTVDEGVNTIEISAFSNSNLISIILPSTLKEIKGNAFYGCSSLKSVTCKATTRPTIDASQYSASFYGLSNATLYIPKGCTSAYEDAGWSTYFTSIVETDFTTDN